MKLFACRVALGVIAVAFAGCGDIAQSVSGSCHGTQAVAGVSVQVCTESPSLTVTNQGTLNSLCRSGQLGATANQWTNGVNCTRTGRVGGCRRVVNGIDVITWLYPSSAAVNAAVVQQFCATISATYVAP